jgi:hypothetical protein
VSFRGDHSAAAFRLEIPVETWKTMYYSVFHPKAFMADLTTVCVKFPPDDLVLLETLEHVERLKRSDIIRRAVRAYAKQLGVVDAAGQAKKPKRK